MIAEDLNIEIDPYWDVFDITDYETFKKKFLHEMYFKPEVHGDVQESFRVIQRLLELGYYEHRFFEVAYTKALLTLEMAFKQRYRELESKEWDGDLWPLMGWLHKRTYFDVYNRHFMKNMLDLRNHFAHPVTGSFAGVGQSNLILYTMDLINGLYEDNRLTGERLEKGKQFFRKIEKLGPGYKVITENEVHFAFNIWLSFYDNKSTPSKIHVFVQPVYEIPNPYFDDNNQFQLSQVYKWLASDLTIEEGAIKLPDETGRVMEIRSIGCEIEMNQFLKWKKGYNDFDVQTGDVVLRSGYATDTFVHYLRDFHKR